MKKEFITLPFTNEINERGAPRFLNDPFAILTGKNRRATFCGIPQVPFKPTSLATSPGTNLDIVSVNYASGFSWSGRHPVEKSLEHLDLPAVPISDAIYFEVESTDESIATPVCCALYGFYDVVQGLNRHQFLPMAPVVSFPMKSTKNALLTVPRGIHRFYALAPKKLSPKFLVIKGTSSILGDENLGMLYLADIKVGKNSQIGSAGLIPATIFSPANEYLPFVDNCEMLMTMSVDLNNIGTSEIQCTMDVVCEPINEKRPRY